MRNYELYIIDELVADYFYGREQMFFHLFKDLHESQSKIREILLKQVEYITKPIPSFHIYTHIMQDLQSRTDFYMKNDAFIIENKRGKAELTIGKRQVVVRSSGSVDAEMIFMETLRKSEYNFLALDLENERYGWLKPLKYRKYV